MSQFQFELTEDGSPTARILLEPGGTPSEAMHSLRGAFSETVYIYGACLNRASLERSEPLRTLSMGLGLGYVELLSTAIALRDGHPVAGESFEIVPELRDHFRNWLTGEVSCPVDFESAYEEINRRTAQEIGVDAVLIRQALARSVKDGSWVLREALDGQTKFQKKFTAICFDAFSSKSTPDLWSEDFLREFLQKTAAPSAVLSTYACTGALKRSLRAEGFEITSREGFSSKRDSTFATRFASQIETPQFEDN